MRQEPGFTLIELVVTIAVASILLTVAIPSFRSTIQNNRVTGQANEFLTSLTLARSEAVKRSTNASVCVSSDGATCTNGTNWANGWLIWSDNNNNGTLDAGETLQVHAALPTGSTFTGPAVAVQYIPAGTAAAATFTLTASGSTDNPKRISINAVGRPCVGPLSTCP